MVISIFSLSFASIPPHLAKCFGSIPNCGFRFQQKQSRKLERVDRLTNEQPEDAPPIPTHISMSAHNNHSVCCQSDTHLTPNTRSLSCKDPCPFQESHNQHSNCDIKVLTIEQQIIKRPAQHQSKEANEGTASDRNCAGWICVLTIHSWPFVGLLHLDGLQVERL